MRIVVVAVGRMKAPWHDDVEHYRKMLARHTRLEVIEVREGDDVARRLPRDSYVVLLDRTGDEMDSLQFADFLEERRRSGRDLCFVVGGPFGLELDGVDRRLALGRMTLAHQLARVVLLEQLFRAHKILAGEPYHY